MHIDPDHPAYFALDDTPTLLLGGSDEDNPFQWSEQTLIPHLDQLVEVGGNFLRNTLSDRDPGNVPPFVGEAGRFHLDQWNATYWNRLAFFLDETARRSICVQITLWDQHDFTGKSWDRQAWNPANNNIGLAESELHGPNDFFRAVARRNALVLPYQRKFVRRVMEHTLPYDHVCYNICNEGWAGIEWECEWARYIRRIARQHGRNVLVTTQEHGPEMSLDAALEHPEHFDYVELSQMNNASTGYADRAHYLALCRCRDELRAAGRVMPMQMEKIYGADSERETSFGDTAGAIRKFWQAIFAGCASARFHRPSAGLGLSEPARQQIRLARRFAQSFDVVASEPVHAPRADADTCFLRSAAGAWAVYFPQAQTVGLDLQSPHATRHVSWLALGDACAAEPRTLTAQPDGTLTLTPPADGPWVAIVN